jgi:hypothetical protein
MNGRMVRLFATLHQLRRLRERSRRADLTVGQTHHARAEVRGAIALIAWLRHNSTTLADCTQRQVDCWLAENPPRNRRIRAFLLWTSRNHHTGDIEVSDQLRRYGTRTAIEDDRRWALVRCRLHEDSVALQDRVAGLLLLLFGQQLSKVARLKRDQIGHDDGGTRIVLGAEPLDLPSPLDGLVRQLADNRRGHAVLVHADNHPWLFPGGAPGRPIIAARLMTRLHPLASGISLVEDPACRGGALLCAAVSVLQEPVDDVAQQG